MKVRITLLSASHKLEHQVNNMSFTTLYFFRTCPHTFEAHIFRFIITQGIQKNTINFVGEDRNKHFRCLK